MLPEVKSQLWKAIQNVAATPLYTKRILPCFEYPGKKEMICHKGFNGNKFQGFETSIWYGGL